MAFKPLTNSWGKPITKKTTAKLREMASGKGSSGRGRHAKANAAGAKRALENIKRKKMAGAKRTTEKLKARKKKK